MSQAINFDSDIPRRQMLKNIPNSEILGESDCNEDDELVEFQPCDGPSEGKVSLGPLYQSQQRPNNSEERAVKA